MIVKFLLKFLGIALAAMPQWVVSCLCSTCGWLIYYFYHSRRRILLSNLDHAFPDKSFSWKRNIAITSCARTVELGLLSISITWFSKQRLKKNFTIDDSIEKSMVDYSKENLATVILIPHFSLLEAMTTLSTHLPNMNKPEIGVIYRPFRSPAIENYIKRTREKFGFKLLSRKNCLFEAKKILKDRGILGILFDQNAGKNGLLSTFFGRIASTTGLPDIFFSKFNVKIFILFPRRIGFWKSVSSFQELDLQRDRENSVAFAMNRWLEKTLISSDDICADWLWMHNRWHTQDEASAFLHISAKRTDNLDLIEKKTRIFLRLPNWLGDVLMALPAIRAISHSRKDVYLTIVAKEQFCELLRHLHVGDDYIHLPKKGLRYFYEIFKYRKLFPDFYILLTNSFRGDLEARIIGCPKTFGMICKGKFRPLLTNGWKVPNFLKSDDIHQEVVIHKFFEAMGLSVPIDTTPLLNNSMKDKKIALICGSENCLEKRWPVRNWCELIYILLEKYCDYEILLIGTDADGQITKSIKSIFFDCSAVTNLAGKTSLVECLEILAVCTVAIGNDTGGIHLANATGCPVVVIYGPTNPQKTGPVFDCQVKFLKKSENLAVRTNMSSVNVSDVIAAVEDIICI
jgi:lauroyl/myristoyl acyltransferase/ADP-heptose:LPS heptosyltransferase